MRLYYLFRKIHSKTTLAIENITDQPEGLKNAFKKFLSYK
jgi:hypothetical protein